MTTVSAGDVGHQYVLLFKRIKRVIDTSMGDSRLSFARATLLKQLEGCESMKQSDLAAALRMAPRSITDAVDSLERDGFAVRTDDPGDRRARLVALTDTGREALNDALQAKAEVYEHIFGQLSATKRAAFYELLSELYAALEESDSPQQ